MFRQTRMMPFVLCFKRSQEVNGEKMKLLLAMTCPEIFSGVCTVPVKNRERELALKLYVSQFSSLIEPHGSLLV